MKNMNIIPNMTFAKTNHNTHLNRLKKAIKINKVSIAKAIETIVLKKLIM